MKVFAFLAAILLALCIVSQLPYFLYDGKKIELKVDSSVRYIEVQETSQSVAPLSFTEVPIETYINGLLGIYELNRVELLKDVFLWAYDRSAKQYAAQRQSLGEPDLFRLKYRNIIKQLIAELLRKRMTNTWPVS